MDFVISSLNGIDEKEKMDLIQQYQSDDDDDDTHQHNNQDKQHHRVMKQSLRDNDNDVNSQQLEGSNKIHLHIKLPSISQLIHDDENSKHTHQHLVNDNTRMNMIKDVNVVTTKKRRYEHVEGQWPTSIYIPILSSHSDTTLSSTLQSYTTSILHQLSSAIVPSVCIDEWYHIDTNDIHLSLSRNFPTLLSQHDALVSELTDAIKNEIRQYQQTAEKKHSITLTFDTWRLYYNDDKTRLFASLRLASSTTNKSTSLIHSLLHHIDSVLSNHQLPSFYQPADPHISLCWTIHPNAMNIDTSIVSTIHRLEHPIDIDIHQIDIKIGSKVYSIAF